MSLTAISNSLAGYLAGRGADIEWLGFAGTAGIAFALYSAGMVLNDLADERKDRILHPERPLPRGELSRAAAWALALGLVAMAGGCAMLLDATKGAPTVAPAAGALLLSILLYDWAAKSSPWFGPPVMGSCRALVFFVGVSASEAGWDADWQGYGVLLFGYVTLVTCISLLEEAKDSGRGYPLAMVTLAACPLGLIAWSGPRGLAGTAVSGILLWKLWSDLSSRRRQSDSDGPGARRGKWSPMAARPEGIVETPPPGGQIDPPNPIPGGIPVRRIQSTIGLALRCLILLDSAFLFSLGRYTASLCLLPLFVASWILAKKIRVTS